MVKSEDESLSQKLEIDLGNLFREIPSTEHTEQFGRVKLGEGFGYVLTSELVYRSETLDNDHYGSELRRRLESIGLDAGQIHTFYEFDRNIMKVNKNDILERARKGSWVRRKLFVNGVTNESYMPKKLQLTLSELILYTDEATRKLANEQHVLNPQTLAAVKMAAAQTKIDGGAIYAKAAEERARILRLTDEQLTAFIRNEYLTIDKHKWNGNVSAGWG